MVVSWVGEGALGEARREYGAASDRVCLPRACQRRRYLARPPSLRGIFLRHEHQGAVIATSTRHALFIHVTMAKLQMSLYVFSATPHQGPPTSTSSIRVIRGSQQQLLWYLMPLSMKCHTLLSCTTLAPAGTSDFPLLCSEEIVGCGTSPKVPEDT